MEHTHDTTHPDFMPPAADGPIAQVREGMDVIDASGDKIGTVEMIKMGDPQAATVDSDVPTENWPGPGYRRFFAWNTEPDLPPAIATRLMRTGFIKIDAKGLFAKDRYVAADRIASVSNDAVRLTVNKDDLAKEE